MAYDCFIDIIHLHCVLIYKHLYFVCSLDLECSFNRYSQGSRAYCRWACLLGCWLNYVKETFLQYRGITYFFVNQKGCTCNKLAWGISYTSCSKDCNLFSLNNFHEQEKLKSIFSVSMISSVKGDVIKIKWLLENLWLIIFTFKAKLFIFTFKISKNSKSPPFFLLLSQSWELFLSNITSINFLFIIATNLDFIPWYWAIVKLPWSLPVFTTLCMPFSD